MKGIADWLKSITNTINQSSKAKQELSNWIKSYWGKILQWSNSEGDFFLVLTKKGVSFCEGDYPSPEIKIITETSIWMDIIEKRLPYEQLKKLMKDDKMTIYGNLNELYDLLNFLKAIA